jgi:choline dehydrogenase-like flavoprotein
LLAERINPGETVADLTSWLRATCEHIYHPAGTCRIGPEGEGVLDPQLKVRGVSGLRVADAAAMPRVTRGNTNAPVYMIAERCAEFMLAGR